MKTYFLQILFLTTFFASAVLQNINVSAVTEDEDFPRIPRSAATYQVIPHNAHLEREGSRTESEPKQTDLKSRRQPSVWDFTFEKISQIGTGRSDLEDYQKLMLLMEAISKYKPSPDPQPELFHIASSFAQRSFDQACYWSRYSFKLTFVLLECFVAWHILTNQMSYWDKSN